MIIADRPIGRERREKRQKAGNRPAQHDRISGNARSDINIFNLRYVNKCK